jgi:60 kDa SS-A/Ro ribonucleoprotein
MANYKFATKNATATPQSKPIPRRKSEMRKNLAGGYGFKASDWQALRRWLLVGSMYGAYYQGKEEMTEQNVEVLERLIKEDPVRVAEEILSASKKGMSWQTPVYALVLLSMGDGRAKNAFKEVFNEVIRNASQLYSFFSYVKGLRGFGTLIHKAVKGWLETRDANELEYQFLKYQQRAGWSGKDVLRMIKPVADDNLKTAVYNWVAGGTKKNPFYDVFPAELERINVYEKLKKGASESDVGDAINKYRLTWEMIPGNIKQTKKTWIALFDNMPVGATIRNLGNLTEKGVFDAVKRIDHLEARLSKERLAKAYIHPIALASAMKIYESGGGLGKSKLTWDPVPRIHDILDVAIEGCFDSVEPTGLHFFHACDVSGSMTGGSVGNMWMTPLEVEGVMCLATVRSEKNYFVGGFDTNFKVLSGFRRTTSFADVMVEPDIGWGLGRTNQRSKSIWPSNFGGTDADAAYRYAIKNNIYTDVFVFWTDSESWSGRRHPAQGLKEYRSKINKNAIAIYNTLVPYGDHITLADPKDPRSYDIAGFTSETPRLINMFARGEL